MTPVDRLTRVRLALEGVSLGDAFGEQFFGWSTVIGLGDRDTTCAIAGGVVALAVGEAALPTKWLTSRETLR